MMLKCRIANALPRCRAGIENTAHEKGEWVSKRVDEPTGITFDTDMNRPSIVIDTNVVIAALRSRPGSSHRLVMLAGTGKFDMSLSVPLVLEYESVALRQAAELQLEPQTIEEIIGYPCSIGRRHRIHYLWRPVLPDPKDDMVLEVAVAGRCESIVTFNERDFRGAERFGIRVITPQAFLREIGEIP